MRRGKLRWGVIIGVVAILAILVAGCAGPAGEAGATGPTGPAGTVGTADTVGIAGCSECHDDTTLILSKSLQSDTTTHMTGGAHDYAGGRAGCTACHSSEGFTAMVAMGLDPVEYGELDEAPTNPSPQNCRTCHQIHTTYTEADWALTTTAPVTLYASGETFDRGAGNLCASCHQPRRLGPEEGGGDFEVTSTHWGPHHGPQSAVLLGISAYGVPDSVSIHYTLVDDGCPVCHVADDNHTLAASTAGCQSCHAELDTLDRNDVQTEIKALYNELKDLLLAEGLLELVVDAEGEMVLLDEGVEVLAYEPAEVHPHPGIYTEEQAGALWNWLIVYEDNSLGIHNPSWIEAILEKGIELMQ